MERSISQFAFIRSCPPFSEVGAGYWVSLNYLRQKNIKKKESAFFKMEYPVIPSACLWVAIGQNALQEACWMVTLGGSHDVVGKCAGGVKWLPHTQVPRLRVSFSPISSSRLLLL